MNTFKNMPLPAQLVVTLVVMLAIGFGGWKFWPDWEGKQKIIRQKRENLEGLSAKISEGRNLEKNLGALKKEIARLESELDKLKQIIPPLRYDSELIQKFESLAKRARLRLNNISHQKLRQKEFYDEYPILLEVLATYHDLAKFFDRLSRQQRIFNVQGVAIRQQVQGSTTVMAKFTALTFIYREDAPLIAPKAEVKGKKKKKKADDEKIET